MDEDIHAIDYELAYDETLKLEKKKKDKLSEE